MQLRRILFIKSCQFQRIQRSIHQDYWRLFTMAVPVVINITYDGTKISFRDSTHEFQRTLAKGDDFRTPKIPTNSEYNYPTLAFILRHKPLPQAKCSLIRAILAWGWNVHKPVLVSGSDNGPTLVRHWLLRVKCGWWSCSSGYRKCLSNWVVFVKGSGSATCMQQL